MAPPAVAVETAPTDDADLPTPPPSTVAPETVPAATDDAATPTAPNAAPIAAQQAVEPLDVADAHPAPPAQATTAFPVADLPATTPTTTSPAVAAEPVPTADSDLPTPAPTTVAPETVPTLTADAATPTAPNAAPIAAQQPVEPLDLADAADARSSPPAQTTTASPVADLSADPGQPRLAPAPFAPRPLADADGPPTGSVSGEFGTGIDDAADWHHAMGSTLALARTASLDGAETTASATGTHNDVAAPKEALRVGPADRDAWATLASSPAAISAAAGSDATDANTADDASDRERRDEPGYAMDPAGFEWALSEPDADDEVDAPELLSHPSDALTLQPLYPQLERTGPARDAVGPAEGPADLASASADADGPVAHEAQVQIDDQLSVRVTTHGQRVDVTLQTDRETWRSMSDLGPTLAADLATAGFQLGSFQGEDPREERPGTAQPIGAQPRSATGKRVALYRYERYV